MNTTKTKRVLIIPDMHVPYHHRPNVRLLLKVAESVGFDVAVIMGDFLDLHSLSRHPKRIPGNDAALGSEIRAGNAVLDALDHVLRFPCRKVFLCGNHDDRLGRYLAQTPALGDGGLRSLEDALYLGDRCWEFHPYGKPVRIGKVWFCHDFGNAGEGAHAIALRKAGGSVVIGHTHRCAMLVRGDAKGVGHVGAMFGWLGDPQHALEYKDLMSQRAEWTQAFGVGVMLPDGTIHLSMCPIVNGKVAVFGEVYSL